MEDRRNGNRIKHRISWIDTLSKFISIPDQESYQSLNGVNHYDTWQIYELLHNAESLVSMFQYETLDLLHDIVQSTMAPYEVTIVLGLDLGWTEQLLLSTTRIFPWKWDRCWRLPKKNNRAPDSGFAEPVLQEGECRFSQQGHNQQSGLDQGSHKHRDSEHQFAGKASFTKGRRASKLPSWRMDPAWRRMILMICLNMCTLGELGSHPQSLGISWQFPTTL